MTDNQPVISNLQRFETWNTLIPIYKEFLENAMKRCENDFFVNYYKTKVKEAVETRQKAYDKLSQKQKASLKFN